MKILVSNDDGIHAPGILALAEAMRALGEVTVIAPDRNQSGSSSSLTLHAPLHVNWLDRDHCAVQGTPADCIHLAMTGLLDFTPDIVVSGINQGVNLGDDVIYSGTVAAAAGGRHCALPAMAVSLAGREHYSTAAHVATLIVSRIKNAPPQQSGTILNVNVPDVPIAQLGAMCVTRLGSRQPSEATMTHQDPRDRTVYWIGRSGPPDQSGPGTDFHALEQGCVSVTPLHTDLTKHDETEALKDWIC